jgi:DNA-binding NtrC family response regulator
VTGSLSPFSALVVEPHDHHAIFAVSALTGVGFTVTLADTFEKARELLISHPPLVLVTDIRLGSHNGLQLAIRAAGMTPALTVVVTSNVPDIVLQRDAERIGATFVEKPVTAAELTAAVFRTALRKPNADGILEPVRPPFERRQGDRRLDVARVDLLERRRLERRRDVQGLLVRAAAMSSG